MRRTSIEPQKRGPVSLDFAILRERYREGRESLGFDPRISPEVIAGRLRVSPATVRRRLAEWRARGFFRGYDVLPHPGLLGGRYAVRVMDFPNAVAQENALGPLSLIDGVIQIVPSRNMLMVAYFVDSDAQAERRSKQFEGIDGLNEMGSEMTFVLPPCARPMSRPDWRLLRALRQNPEAKLADLAGEVGQSQKTTSRRFDSLLDQGALMFDPILDYSRFSQTLAVLVAFLDSPDRAHSVEREVQTLLPQAMRSWGPVPTDPAEWTSNVEFLVAARTAGELDALTARVAHVPGVDQALLWHPRLTLSVPDWLNERIDNLLKAIPPGG